MRIPISWVRHHTGISKDAVYTEGCEHEGEASEYRCNFCTDTLRFEHERAYYLQFMQSPRDRFRLISVTGLIAYLRMVRCLLLHGTGERTIGRHSIHVCTTCHRLWFRVTTTK